MDKVARFAEQLETDALLCRTWGHAWNPLTSTVRRQGDHLHWFIQCRCGTVRERILTTTGAIVGNRYKYPQGYRQDGMGRLGGAGNTELRRAMIRRMGAA